MGRKLAARIDLTSLQSQTSLNSTFQFPKAVTWQAQTGSQEAFLSAKHIFEVLYEGTRGPGKTDTLIMDFYSDVGKGYGAAWKGILFRQTYKQLADVIAKTKKWFHLVCPEAKYNSSEHYWTFPGGEMLLLRQFLREDDYWNYHGHEYPWVGWEELCNWHNLGGYMRMMSTCRSSHPEVAKIIRYRSTTNPYGPGHNVVKHRFNLPGSRGIVNWNPIDEEGNRCHLVWRFMDPSMRTRSSSSLTLITLTVYVRLLVMQLNLLLG